MIMCFRFYGMPMRRFVCRGILGAIVDKPALGNTTPDKRERCFASDAARPAWTHARQMHARMQIAGCQIVSMTWWDLNHAVPLINYFIGNVSIGCMPDTLQVDSPPLSLKRWRMSTTFTTIPRIKRLAPLRNCTMPDVEIKVGWKIQETIQES